MTRSHSAKLYLSLDKCKSFKNKDGSNISVKKNLIKATIKNKSLLKDDFDIIVEAEKSYNDTLQAFNLKRQEVIKRFCILDEKNNPILEDNMYKFSDNTKSNECAIALSVELKDEKSKLDQAEKLLIELSNEESDVKEDSLLKIEENDIPEEGDAEILEMLYSIVI